MRVGRGVAIITTGTELRSPGETLLPGQIFESNGPMLAALFARAGADVSLQRAVVDDDEAHRVALRVRARRRCRRHLRRRLGRPARPRPWHARRARRSRGVLGRGDATRQAAALRSPRADADLRPARQSGVVARRSGAVRRPGAPCAPGRYSPRARLRAWTARVDHRAASRTRRLPARLDQDG